MIRKNLQGVILTSLAILLLAAAGCTRDSLEPSLKQNLQEDKLSTVVELNAALDAAYDFMGHYTYYGRDYIIYNEIRSDNCFSTGHSNRFTNFWNRLLPTDGYVYNTWFTIYKVIGQCNFVISKENTALEGDTATKKYVEGQAYALRALAHFDLFKLFGAMHVTAQQAKGIPYITEWRSENKQPERTAPEAIKTRLYADLDAAIKLLENRPTDAAYMNIHAAHALKARVAQWFGDWAIAEAEAKAVVDANAYSIIPAADYIGSWRNKFNKNSLFEMSYNLSDNQNIDGIGNIYWGSAYGDVAPTPELVELLTKDPNDVRSKIIAKNEELEGRDQGSLGYYLANSVKYSDVLSYNDNIPLFRYEEVVLIYAEALMHNGKANEALVQLNSIATNRGASPYTEATEETILQERRKELCFEGFRFDDLARTKQAVPRSTINDKGLIKRSYEYGSSDYTLPIPKNELNANANLQQNAGY